MAERVIDELGKLDRKEALRYTEIILRAYDAGDVLVLSGNIPEKELCNRLTKVDILELKGNETIRDVEYHVYKLKPGEGEEIAQALDAERMKKCQILV